MITYTLVFFLGMMVSGSQSATPLDKPAIVSSSDQIGDGFYYNWKGEVEYRGK